ncbi:tail fiber assembly protein [Rahnella inusitata]|uniref:tail fiber assembly protein n=1 Tax=Rahnella inusitata TaxID=58169 RepID=UPI001BC8320D|nr:tail fiber assembly protein [Rahnella inusitata]QUT17067.1 tail fiber assembly protein [Rahnella inusitata]
MITFKNITISKQVLEEGIPLPVLYFEDETGQDWYKLRDEKWQGESCFIAVGADGFISTWADNPNFLTLSEGVSIYEISPEALPEDVSDHPYRYENGEFMKFVQPAIEVAALQKSTLLSQAAAAIAPLQDAVDVDDATDDELASLKAWKQYRVALNRLDLAAAPDIDWPAVPE